MPLFEYDCRVCGHRFELLVRGLPPSTKPTCPSCKTEEIELVPSAFGVSSAASRHASIQRARRELTRSRDRTEQLHAQGEETREHLRDDYGITVPEKPKSIV